MQLDTSTSLPGNQQLSQMLLSCVQTQKQKIPSADHVNIIMKLDMYTTVSQITNWMHVKWSK
jgi:hypothetical protein